MVDCTRKIMSENEFPQRFFLGTNLLKNGFIYLPQVFF